MGLGIVVKSGWSREDRRREYTAFWTGVYPSVVRAVEASFRDAGMQSPTGAELKARIEFCKVLVDQLRIEFGWSKRRIKDSIEDLLRRKLLGLPLDIERISRRVSW